MHCTTYPFGVCNEVKQHKKCAIYILNTDVIWYCGHANSAELPNKSQFTHWLWTLKTTAIVSMNGYYKLKALGVLLHHRLECVPLNVSESNFALKRWFKDELTSNKSRVLDIQSRLYLVIDAHTHIFMTYLWEFIMFAHRRETRSRLPFNQQRILFAANWPFCVEQFLHDRI